MKYFLSILVLIAVIFGSAPVFSSADKVEAVIESVRFIGKDSGMEIIQIQLTRRVEPSVMKLQGDKPRIVLDFIDTVYSAKLKQVVAVDGELVAKIRMGQHYKPEIKTRVVVDLLRDFPGEVRLSYEASDKVIDIQIPVGESEATAKVKKVEPQQGVEEDTKEQIKRTVESDEKISSALPKEQVLDYAKPTAEKKPVPDTAGDEATQSPVEMLGDVSILDEQSSSESTGETGIAQIKDDDIPVLLNVSFERSTNDKEMVLFKLSGFHPPVVFSTEGEELLVVCDFLDALLGYGVEKLIETEGKYIGKVKVSEHNDPEKVRVVLELVGKYNYDLKQVFFKEDDLFVIIISNLGEKD